MIPLSRFQHAGSVRLYTEDLEYPFQFRVAEKGYLQSASAMGVAQMDLGPQSFAQLILQVRDVGIPGQWRNGPGPGGGAGLAGLQARDQRLRLTNIEPFFKDALERNPLLCFTGQAQNNFSVADGKAALADTGLKRRREFKEAERVGHHGAALADFSRHLFLLELELLDELRVTLGLFNWVKVLALQILNQCQFEDSAVVGLSQDNRSFSQDRKSTRLNSSHLGISY